MSRIQLAINVRDVDESIVFYSKLLESRSSRMILNQISPFQPSYYPCSSAEIYKLRSSGPAL